MGKNRLRRGVVLALTAGALVFGGQVAYAQTTTTSPYPGSLPTTTTQAGPQSTTVNLGVRGLGAKFTVSICGFKPDKDFTVAVLNKPVPSRKADANSCGPVNFEIKPTLRQVALSTPGLRGGFLAATGFAASSVVDVTVNGQDVEVGPLGSQVITVAKGEALNGQAREVTVIFTVLRSNAVDGNGGLARTGTTILKWSPLGAGLVAVGYMLVLVARRRRSEAVG